MRCMDPAKLTQRGPEAPAIPCVDGADPVCWWKADYGDNETAVAKVLPRLL